MIASMEGKIQQLANQLNEQITLYKELEIKYHRGEAHVVELETRFKSLDSEYCATEVIRDNLKSDRIKVNFILLKGIKKKKTPQLNLFLNLNQIVL